MPIFSFLQLDVFASRLLEGNPLAVVVDAEGLDEATMQRIARWTNLSETAFLLPPSTTAADYRVRIFTPRQELPFAGHPSVGSAYAAIESGLVAAGKGALVQECAAGLLPVRIEGDGSGRVIHVQAPPAALRAVSAAQRSTLGRAVHAELAEEQSCLIDNGPLWFVCDLREEAAVRQLQPDMAAIGALCEAAGAVGVSVFGRQRSGGASMAVRAFCPADGIPEDPVTGSANAAIMAWLGERDGRDGYGLRYRASQGREVGRDGYVEVERDPASGAVTIGGACAIGVRGELQID
ncbi:PhzF family phenazine biosynthesis protein [Rhodanobacter denitrificans]|uniref:PhzF family phenazine biosynthesis protein n=1 Tax=Rhodanobacter denitrificans TaxID=666685 RepID=UPI000260E642|nr:PhzF family phenazine biosynthesis protein [Rhodanobacter denitrificans]EIM00484.1 putative phenazine biosynthesis-like protein [Rhodanobacter denitrificans]UJM91321.1 PhzF family phenazine biosynthesis protein [Rhodanobacter denitrificans]